MTPTTPASGGDGRHVDDGRRRHHGTDQHRPRAASHSAAIDAGRPPAAGPRSRPPPPRSFRRRPGPGAAGSAAPATRTPNPANRAADERRRPPATAPIRGRGRSRGSFAAPRGTRRPGTDASTSHERRRTTPRAMLHGRRSGRERRDEPEHGQHAPSTPTKATLSALPMNPTGRRSPIVPNNALAAAPGSSESCVSRSRPRHGPPHHNVRTSPLRSPRAAGRDQGADPDPDREAGQPSPPSVDHGHRDGDGAGEDDDLEDHLGVAGEEDRCVDGGGRSDQRRQSPPRRQRGVDDRATATAPTPSTRICSSCIDLVRTAPFSTAIAPANVAAPAASRTDERGRPCRGRGTGRERRQQRPSPGSSRRAGRAVGAGRACRPGGCRGWSRRRRWRRSTVAIRPFRKRRTGDFEVRSRVRVAIERHDVPPRPPERARDPERDDCGRDVRRSPSEADRRASVRGRDALATPVDAVAPRRSAVAPGRSAERAVLEAVATARPHTWQDGKSLAAAVSDGAAASFSERIGTMAVPSRPSTGQSMPIVGSRGWTPCSRPGAYPVEHRYTTRRSVRQ